MENINHISLIMDGNRRYGKKKGISEYDAYVNGTKKALELCQYLAKNNIKYISLWALSKDNNKRDTKELSKSLKNKYFDEMITNFKCIFIGDIDRLSQDIKERVLEYKDQNSEIKIFKYSTIIYIFLNYSGSFDVEYTVNNCLKNHHSNINFQEILNNSYVKDIPSIDLLIRTGGRQRLSDFAILLLLYSEIYFSKKLWNEFSIKNLNKILQDYKDNRFCTYGM